VSRGAVRHLGGVARMERSEIRGSASDREDVPGFAALNLGYACVFVLARRCSPEVCLFPPHTHEGAERRQALGCSGTRRQTSNVGLQALARRLAFPRRPSFRSLRSRGTLASRRSTAAIVWPRARLGEAFGRCTRAALSGLTLAHSRVPLVVAEGRVSPGASRERGYEPRTQDAASRSASGSSPEDALSERDSCGYIVL
jgi:hypothetical protein